MTRTTGRTLQLLGLLQARRDWSGAELRERLEVSARTLRRDIDDLRALGYGVEATRGVSGGYRLGPGASVPPLTLAADEAVAIAVGLRAAALGVITGLEDASARALAKLEQSLAAGTRERIAEVARAMVPLVPARHDIDLEVVTTIARGISESRRVRIDYTRHDGGEVRRRIEPHRIVHTAERWYLIAWDADRHDWRTLRVDRMSHPHVLREPFTPRNIPDDQLRTFTSRNISTAPYRYRATVRMLAPADEVARQFDALSVDLADNGDGTTTLTAGSNSPDEFAVYLGVSGFDFEVLEGDEVRAAVGGVAARLARASGLRALREDGGASV